MQMRSSASRTWSASRSAVEWAAIAVTSSSWQARTMRTATSPRLAIRTRRNTRSRRVENEERRPVLDRCAVRDQDAAHGRARLGGDLVHHLHRLDDAEHLADLDQVALGDERCG